MATTSTPRERVWQAIRHVQPERIPYSIDWTIPAREKLEKFYGTTDLDRLLDNHLAKYAPQAPDDCVEVRPNIWRDEFGVEWNRSEDKDIGIVENYPLKSRSFSGVTFPDPRKPARYAALPAFCEENKDRFRVVGIGYSMFERAWIFRSMPELMIDMLEAPEFVDELLDMITEYQLAIVREVVKHDIDGIRFGDDWGQQKGLLFGGRLWRRFIKPRVARLYAEVKAAGKAVIIHSCGQVQELFPDLIEIGVDVFNPFQPEVMDLVEMKKQYGRQLAFYGGMSIQKVLPFGTVEEVRAETRRLIDKIGAGGGYIIAPSHDMPGDIPVENMVAFIEILREE